MAQTAPGSGGGLETRPDPRGMEGSPPVGSQAATSRATPTPVCRSGSRAGRRGAGAGRPLCRRAGATPTLRGHAVGRPARREGRGPGLSFRTQNKPRGGPSFPIPSTPLIPIVSAARQTRSVCEASFPNLGLFRGKKLSRRLKFLLAHVWRATADVVPGAGSTPTSIQCRSRSGFLWPPSPGVVASGGEV